MAKIDKNKILKLILKELEVEIDVHKRAANDAKENATSDESKPEDQYDTRGLEASYIAGAQSQRAEDMAMAYEVLKRVKIKEFSKDTPIAVSALIEIQDADSESRLYFLLPNQGGMKVELEGKTIHTISPDSPMGGSLVGKITGDVFEITIKGEAKNFEVVSVT